MEYPQRYSVQGEDLFLCGDQNPTYWPGHNPNHIGKLFGQKMVMRLITLFPCFRFFFLGEDFCNTYVGGVARAVAIPIFRVSHYGQKCYMLNHMGGV
jgi:hypothetical protein